jgi:glutaredoxin-like protein
MPILDENIRKEIQALFENLKNPVKLCVFTRKDTIDIPGRECPTCKDNDALIKEVAGLSDKITAEFHDHLTSDELTEKYAITQVPATLVQSEKDHGIRFFGVPAGHEFATLLNAIKMVSNNKTDLTPAIKEKLKLITKPIHIQVYVTLACPYCAPAAALAHSMALENENIKADMINAQEFPELAQKYNVYAVPKIVINETVQFEGALPEQAFLDKVFESIK